ncbi:ABC transporter permease, partial [archaeon]
PLVTEYEKLLRPAFPASYLPQVGLIIGKKTLAFCPSLRELMGLMGTLSLVALTVTVTFSYSVYSDLELPYQSVMLVSLLSLYVMILQYLILVPEYMAERASVWSDMQAKYLSPGIYIFANICIEVPRAMLQTLLVYTILYMVHPLNPDPWHMAYTYLLTLMGLFSWQGLICLVAMTTDVIAVAYSTLFLILGSGTLFGGLLVRYSKIPIIFRWLYYVSVAAVTQRALIANDLRCCYLTTTCNSIANSLHLNPSSEHESQGSYFDTYTPYYAFNSSSEQDEVQPAFCPAGLQFSGDGSDVGNLGRLYLLVSTLM